VPFAKRRCWIPATASSNGRSSSTATSLPGSVREAGEPCTSCSSFQPFQPGAICPPLSRKLPHASHRRACYQLRPRALPHDRPGGVDCRSTAQGLLPCGRATLSRAASLPASYCCRSGPSPKYGTWRSVDVSRQLCWFEEGRQRSLETREASPVVAEGVLFSPRIRFDDAVLWTKASCCERRIPPRRPGPQR
jgi:hypothetical protein